MSITTAIIRFVTNLLLNTKTIPSNQSDDSLSKIKPSSLNTLHRVFRSFYQT